MDAAARRDASHSAWRAVAPEDSGDPVPLGAVCLGTEDYSGQPGSAAQKNAAKQFNLAASRFIHGCALAFQTLHQRAYWQSAAGGQLAA